MSEPGSFSPHRNFSENLMVLCTQHGSIAAVCRALEMNRQQFNKYLSGASFPNPTTLEKIASYFNVPVEVLFQDPRGFRGTSLWPSTPLGEILSKLPLQFLSNMAGLFEALKASTLRTGVYFFYYPWPRDSRLCARATLYVYERDGITYFTRFTKFRALGQQQKYYLRGRHDGVALESEGSKFMLGFNRKGFRDVSLVSFGVDNTLQRGLLSGLALVMGATANPLALRVFMEYRGARDVLRRCIAETGILPLSHPNVPEEIREALQDVPALTTPSLTPFTLVDRLSVDLMRSTGAALGTSGPPVNPT